MARRRPGGHRALPRSAVRGCAAEERCGRVEELESGRVGSEADRDSRSGTARTAREASGPRRQRQLRAVPDGIAICPSDVRAKDLHPRPVGRRPGILPTATPEDRVPGFRATPASSSASRLLPIPGSPPIRTSRPCPCSARAIAERRSSSSRSRPMSPLPRSAGRTSTPSSSSGSTHSVPSATPRRRPAWVGSLPFPADDASALKAFRVDARPFRCSSRPEGDDGPPLGRESTENESMSQITKTAQVKPRPQQRHLRTCHHCQPGARCGGHRRGLPPHSTAGRPFARGGGRRPADRWLPAGCHRGSRCAAGAQCPGVVRRLGGQPRWTDARRSERGARRVGGRPDRASPSPSTNCATGGRPGWWRRRDRQRHHRWLGVVALQVGIA